MCQVCVSCMEELPRCGSFVITVLMNFPDNRFFYSCMKEFLKCARFVVAVWRSFLDESGF